MRGFEMKTVFRGGTIHVRKRYVKRGGNQFYKSTSYSGGLVTICGADLTDRDLTILDVKKKSFDREKYERLTAHKICRDCLRAAGF